MHFGDKFRLTNLAGICMQIQHWHKIEYYITRGETERLQRGLHGKKFGADVAPSGEAVAFSVGELCDYAFGYAAFPLWVSSCPFLGEHLSYIDGTQRSFR